MPMSSAYWVRDSLDLRVTTDLESCYLGFYYAPPNDEFHLVEHKPSGCIEYQEYYYAVGEFVRPINGYSEKVGYYIERFAH